MYLSWVWRKFCKIKDWMVLGYNDNIWMYYLFGLYIVKSGYKWFKGFV